MSETGLVKYGSFTAEALAEDKERIDALTGKMYLDLEPGDNVLRFLPPLVGVRSPFRMTSQHYIDGRNIGLGDKTFIFACPRVEHRAPCAACERAEELLRSGQPGDRDIAKKIACGPRCYANVIHRGHMEPTPRVLAMGPVIFNSLTAIRKNARIGGDFTNPGPQGFDIVITKTGSGIETRYVVAACREPSVLHDDPAVMEALIYGQHNLEQCVVPVVPDELLNVWSTQSFRVQRPTGVQVPAAYRVAPQPSMPVPQQVATGQRVGASVVGRTAVDDVRAAPKEVVTTQGGAVDPWADLEK